MIKGDWVAMAVVLYMLFAFGLGVVVGRMFKGRSGDE